MNNNISVFINKIVRNKIPCYFISPHLDDAALSAGGLITYLAEKTKVRVITIFTNSNTYSSLSAKAFLKQCHYTNSIKLYEDRRKEDSQAYKSIHVSTHYLGYTEALWRTKSNNITLKFFSKIIPEINCAYPTFRFHIAKGIIAKSDRQLINNIFFKLRSIIPEQEENAVFTSFGVGNHVDHIITRYAVENIANPVYWIDQPYRKTEYESHLRTSRNTLYRKQKKRNLCSFYKTQLEPLFGHMATIIDLDEDFIL